MTTASNPIIPTNGLESKVAEVAKAIRNKNYKLLAVKPNESREVAYIWRRVALEVSPKEALQRAITKVFTNGFSDSELKSMDKMAEKIIEAVNIGISTQETLANMVESVKEDVEERCQAHGAGVCNDCQTCHHYWEIERAGLLGNSPTSKGICLHCGKVGQFFNSIHSQLKAAREAMGMDEDEVESVDDSEKLMELAMRDAMSAMVDYSF